MAFSFHDVLVSSAVFFASTAYHLTEVGIQSLQPSQLAAAAIAAIAVLLVVFYCFSHIVFEASWWLLKSVLHAILWFAVIHGAKEFVKTEEYLSLVAFLAETRDSFLTAYQQARNGRDAL